MVPVRVSRRGNSRAGRPAMSADGVPDRAYSGGYEEGGRFLQPATSADDTMQ